jgi:hypothetical protein
MGRKKHSVNSDLDQLIRQVLLPLEARSDIISPAFIANEVDKIVDPENETHELKTHGFILYVRERARKIIAERHDPVQSDEDDAQISMFKGLQDYYPRAGDMTYIRREYMTDADYEYNINRLEAESTAKWKHAEALRADWAMKKMRG